MKARHLETVVALEKTTLIVIEREKFGNMLNRINQKLL